MPDLIVERRPRSRGVTQLMYVGDDEAVESAIGAAGAEGAAEAMVAMAAAGYALMAPKGTSRQIATGIAILAALRVLTR